ncbi:Type II secretion system (T2SS), protein F [Candidatus Gugararchaeum adminiculabundum]|nr:Type II secretion system (T2SS), protein F [Candidatus Gugararchaeum adminiculabundum]
MLVYGLGLGIGIGLIFFNYSLDLSLLYGWAAFMFFEILIYLLLFSAARRRIALIEEALPEFLSIMASNIRSGLTHDRALLMSARKEFGPLKTEVDRAAKLAITGTPLTEALMGMNNRVASETFGKTIRLIVEGVNSGGDLAELLEKTSLDIRRFGALRREINATVMAYKLFIYAAIALGAPLLYAVANFLVRALQATRGKIDFSSLAQAQGSLPINISSGTIPAETMMLFSIAAISLTAIFGCMAAGVITKGKESEGFLTMPVMLFVSLGVFFAISLMLQAVLSGVFGG